MLRKGLRTYTRGGVTYKMSNLLKGEERTKALESISDWKVLKDRDAIYRFFFFLFFFLFFQNLIFLRCLGEFEFQNFDEAFYKFMSVVAEEAEAKDHHPEWFNVYNKVNITLATHTCNGVSEKDISLAKFCDSVFAKVGKKAKTKE